MLNLSDFQRSQIVSARLAGARKTETYQLLDISGGVVSKVITAYTQLDKTNLAKQNSGWKEKLIEIDWRQDKRTFGGHLAQVYDCYYLLQVVRHGG
ncbi:hypothetical protein TNCV_3408131 [Trichonephila clavipes]|nr:hypothetical protein TNCV_3408131 [Trichonephila clavipes]